MLKSISKTNWVIILLGIIPALGWFGYGTFIMIMLFSKIWSAWPLWLLYLGAFLGTIGLFKSLKTGKHKWLKTALLLIGILAMSFVFIILRVYKESFYLGLSMLSPIVIGVFVIFKSHGLAQYFRSATGK